MRLLILLLLLSGCAVPVAISEGTPRSVIVRCGLDSSGWETSEGALTLAEAHCQKHKLHAVSNGRGQAGECLTVFKCVE